ncbi:beta-galactosidase small subunit, partial [Candidatus Sumerlaeota bacterium]
RPVAKGTLHVHETQTRAEITDPVSKIKVTVNKRKGVIEKVIGGGKTIVDSGPTFNVWRAPTDNDGVKGRKSHWTADGRPLGRWMNAGLNKLTTKTKGVSVTPQRNGSVVVVIKQRHTGRQSRRGFDHVHTYTIQPGGVINVAHTFRVDKGLDDLARLGVRMNLAPGFDKLSWFGRGPHESYCDRKAGAPVGLYHGTVAQQYVPYILPQENGNKEDVRWFSLCDDRGRGLRVEAAGPLSFSASHLTPEELTRSYHTHELRPGKDVTVLMDYAQRGLGTLSCGPDALPEYRIDSGAYEWQYRMTLLN